MIDDARPDRPDFARLWLIGARLILSSGRYRAVVPCRMAEGKPVLRSTHEDRVFIYFADHGAVGLIAMPAGEPVYAQDLVDTLTYMWNNQMYRELVFYMEACESGSMFDGLLPTDINIYATTAANPEESSYGTYCGGDSVVDGTVRAPLVLTRALPRQLQLLGTSPRGFVVFTESTVQ